MLGGRNFRAKARGFGAYISRGERSLFRTVNDHQYISIAESQAACRADPDLVNCNPGGGPGQWQCLRDLAARHGIMVPRNAFATYANAQFGVSRDRIEARTLDFYQVHTHDPKRRCDGRHYYD